MKKIIFAAAAFIAMCAASCGNCTRCAATSSDSADTDTVACYVDSTLSDSVSAVCSGVCCAR